MTLLYLCVGGFVLGSAGDLNPGSVFFLLLERTVCVPGSLNALFKQSGVRSCI